MSGLPVAVRSLPLGDMEAVNNQVRVVLLIWAEDKLEATAVRGPTKKGVSLPVEALPNLVAAVVEAEAMACALGLLEAGSATG